MNRGDKGPTEGLWAFLGIFIGVVLIVDLWLSPPAPQVHAQGQNTPICTEVTGTVASGQVLTAGSSNVPPSCSWTSAGGSAKPPIIAPFGSNASSASALTSDTVYFSWPNACTISAWNATINNASGSAIFGVWVIPSGTTLPTVSNSITASLPPGVSGQANAYSTALTGWTTAIAANSLIAINLTTVTLATYASLTLTCN